jgi:hypothetical protein
MGERNSRTIDLKSKKFFDKKWVKNWPGANPTIATYNASVVNFYNVTGSLVHFENKNIFFDFVKTL